MVAVHFFIVAYNTDLVEQHEGDGTAWIAEVILAGKTTWPLLSSYFPSYNVVIFTLARKKGPPLRPITGTG